MEHSRADIMVVADQEQLAKVVEVVVLEEVVMLVEIVVEVVDIVVVTLACRWRRRG